MINFVAPGIIPGNIEVNLNCFGRKVARAKPYIADRKVIGMAYGWKKDKERTDRTKKKPYFARCHVTPLTDVAPS
jgi:hypothetical protein